jgi:hypothetical protein
VSRGLGEVERWILDHLEDYEVLWPDQGIPLPLLAMHRANETPGVRKIDATMRDRRNRGLFDEDEEKELVVNILVEEAQERERLAKLGSPPRSSNRKVLMSVRRACFSLERKGLVASRHELLPSAGGRARQWVLDAFKEVTLPRRERETETPARSRRMRLVGLPGSKLLRPRHPALYFYVLFDRRDLY